MLSTIQKNKDLFEKWDATWLRDWIKIPEQLGTEIFIKLRRAFIARPLVNWSYYIINKDKIRDVERMLY